MTIGVGVVKAHVSAGQEGVAIGVDNAAGTELHHRPPPL